MKSVVFVAIALVASAAFAEKQSIERYQSIIDRQMFGPLPPGFDSTKSPNEVQKSSSKDERQLTQEQEKLQSSIHFSVINVASDGQTEVGFTDNSDPKVPKHYFLKVGETRDGWTVKEASAEDATMTIAKGEIEVSLSLGGNSAKDGGTSKAGGAAANGGARRTGLFGGGLLGGGSLRARRLQRQQAEAADAAKRREEQAAREAEQQAQAEAEKQQREAERAEQRQQLLAIQEELKRVREAKAAEASKSEDNGDGAAEDNVE